MATPIFSFAARDSGTIRDSILRVIRSGLIARGVANPNVLPGSDFYIEAQAIANQLAIVEANAVVKADELMPDTAVDTGLGRICAFFKLAKQPAVGSVGAILISASAAATVTLGQLLVDGAGLSYKTTTSGSFNSGDSIAVAAVSTGAATNHAQGDILRWVATPAFADEKVTVGVGGFVNGADAEDDEALRARLFALLQNPPVSGNAQDVAMFAEASTASVQKGFIYPAIEGPSTGHVATVAAPTSTNKSRDVSSTIMAGTVVPYVQGLLPERMYSVITTVTNVNADVAIGLTLPEAPTAQPPGPGGGWVNGSPWPAPDGVSTFRCTVTGVTSTSVITVDATTPPIVGVSQICWQSPVTGDWKLYSATVVAVSGTSGAYVITLDQPFVGITTGSYIWPKCQNAQLYVNAVLAAYALMGPGEKTTNASALIRGFRHPRPAASWPMSLGGPLTGAITSANSEVTSAAFLHRTDGTTTTTGPGGVVTPQVPAAVSSPPNIYRPRHIAFYRIS